MFINGVFYELIPILTLLFSSAGFGGFPPQNYTPAGFNHATPRPALTASAPRLK